MVIQVGKITSILKGAKHEKTQFVFENGVSWRQIEVKQGFIQVDQPLARVIYQNGTCFLEMEGIDGWIKVTRVC